MDLKGNSKKWYDNPSFNFTDLQNDTKYDYRDSSVWAVEVGTSDFDPSSSDDSWNTCFTRLWKRALTAHTKYDISLSVIVLLGDFVYHFT